MMALRLLTSHRSPVGDEAIDTAVEDEEARPFAPRVAPVSGHTRPSVGASSLTLARILSESSALADPQVLLGAWFTLRGKNIRLAGTPSAFRQAGHGWSKGGYHHPR